MTNGTSVSCLRLMLTQLGRSANVADPLSHRVADVAKAEQLAILASAGCDRVTRAHRAERIVQELRAAQTETPIPVCNSQREYPVFGDAEWSECVLRQTMAQKCRSMSKAPSTCLRFVIGLPAFWKVVGKHSCNARTSKARLAPRSSANRDSGLICNRALPSREAA